MSGLSNYPPGVTGREPQIAGPDAERTMHMVCPGSAEFTSSYTVALMVESYTERLLRLLDNGIVPLESLEAWKVEWKANLAEHTITVDCEWEGDAEVVFQDRVAYWTCPRCGLDHENADLADGMREDAMLERAERERDR